MAKQLLFYESAVPLSAVRHGDWSFATVPDFAFAAAVAAVPLTAVEIPAASAEYAIVFTGSDGDMMPVAFLGSLFSTLLAGAVLLARGEPILALPQDMAVAFAVGFFVVALGMVLFTLGSRVVPAAELTLLSLIEVLLGPIWVWLALGETASRATLIGGAVLLAGVVLNAAMGLRAPRGERGDAATAEGLRKPADL